MTQALRWQMSIEHPTDPPLYHTMQTDVFFFNNSHRFIFQKENYHLKENKPQPDKWLNQQSQTILIFLQGQRNMLTIQIKMRFTENKCVPLKGRPVLNFLKKKFVSEKSTAIVRKAICIFSPWFLIWQLKRASTFFHRRQLTGILTWSSMTVV